MASRAMKVPDTNMRGSRTRFNIDMMSPGLSVGYAAKSVPMVEKQRAVRSIPAMRERGYGMPVPNAMIPTRRGTRAIPRLYMNPERLSPNTIAWSETGADISRSNVLVRRSMGIETGSIVDEEKRRVTEISPGIRRPTGTFFPEANARNMNRGKSRPDTMMFGLR